MVRKNGFIERLTLLFIPLLFFTLVFLPAGAQAATVFIEASQDTTLIEDPDGARSNGAGPYIFAGLTGSNQGGGIRRALVRFDVEGIIPENALIENASLHLYLDRGGPGKIRLHRVFQDWGEGLSCERGGSGAPSETNDATWIHTFYDTDFWEMEGGYFSGAVSTREKVDVRGEYVWNSNRMAKDVQFWLAHPEMNFGWILINNEKTPQSVVAFASRDPLCDNGGPTGSPPPMLEVTYIIP
jgi:hypothetical protein